ncbi:MAG TPA: DUF5317 family protein [Actinomycetota bacterium]|nr:DUF5317 family protein [Actinomycetota bacterium]
MVFLVPLIVGVGIGLGRGGRVADLGRVRFRNLELVVASAALTIGIRTGPSTARWMISVSLTLLVAFLLRNRGLDGFGILASGVALNALVMISNGAMPVSTHAADSLGKTVVDGVRHGVASDRSIFPYLGDVIPVTPLGVVVSAGDILMAIGIVMFLRSAMSPPRPPSPQP